MLFGWLVGLNAELTKNRDRLLEVHLAEEFLDACGKRRFSASTWKRMAGTTGLEPAASAVTGQRSNQLNYVPTRQINEMRNRQCLCGVARIA
jgi:hypothetical protein